MGSCKLGQLIVWEWQSEKIFLNQQGHYNTVRCVSYSPDGMLLVTGGDDGKVRLLFAKLLPMNCPDPSKLVLLLLNAILLPNWFSF